MVLDGQVAAVDDRPAAVAHPQAQVDVLIAVAVALVEAAELLEHGSRKREARPGDAVELVGAAGRRNLAVVAIEEVERQDGAGGAGSRT